jgi:hypothetical protein
LTDKADKNWGLYSDLDIGTKENFNIYASGTALNYFAGDVGIGTDDPQAKLHIEGTAGVIQMTSTTETNSCRINLQGGTSSYAGINFGDSDDSGIGYIRYYNTSDNLYFRTNGTNKMIISAGGNVGIGTDNPQATLHVNGEIITGNWDRSLSNVEGASVNQYGRISLQKKADGNVFEGYLNTDETSKIGSRGNAYFKEEVGIGTNTPQAKLDVRMGYNSKLVFPTGTWAAQIHQQQDTATHNGVVVSSRWANTESVVFLAGSCYPGPGDDQPFKEYFKVLGNGRVSIGTDNPQAKLDVNGTIKATNIQFPGSSSQLDDYEEGTWTPIVEDATAYVVQKGFYTKIGDLVTFSCRTQPSAATPSSNSFSITGLPFQSSNDTNGPYGGAFRTFGVMVDDGTVNNVNWHIPLNSTRLRLYSGQNLVATNNAALTMNSNLIVTGFYYTDQ